MPKLFGGSSNSPLSDAFFSNRFRDNDLLLAADLTLAKASDNTNQLMNVGGIVWGLSEWGIQAIRHNNGPQIIGRFLGFGTQRTAVALRGTLGMVSSFGKTLGLVGYGLTAVTLGAKIINGDGVTTAEGVGFGISTVLLGAGYIAAGTVGAPLVAAAAIVYGIGELGSWLWNGKSLEDNIIGK